MELNLTGRRAVVTGAGAGIGLAITTRLLSEGVRVVGGDQNPSALRGLPGEVSAEVVDFGDAGEVASFAAAAIGTLGGIDILVNNVGIFPYREGFLSVADPDWMGVLNVNLMSMIRMCRETIPHMLEEGAGSIISIASELGRQPDVALVDYSVSKAAMINLSKSLANEFGPVVRSNVVTPGPIRTASWDEPGGFAETFAAHHGLSNLEEAVSHYAETIRKLPSGRPGRPDEISAVVAFLASDISGQVTGSEYAVNGGSYGFA